MIPTTVLLKSCLKPNTTVGSVPTVDQWKAEVQAGNTFLGYLQWVRARLYPTNGEEEEASEVSR